MAKIVIIGAGLTGLSAAYHLEQKGFTDFVLFEKEETVGGLCRSVHQDGFTFDFTGHLIHVSDQYFREFLHTTVGLNNLRAINRKSFIFSHNTYSRYPFQVNLFGLPPEVIADCIEAFATRTRTTKKAHTYPEWVLAQFGTGLAKHFFFPFQRKIFDYDLKQITPSWTGRFVPRTTLAQMIAGALHATDDNDIGYNAHFLYPRAGGIQYWIEKITEKIKTPIHTGYCVRTIDLKEKKIFFTNGHVEPFETLITTMPLDSLLANLIEKPTSALKQAASKLICNSVVNFNLGINRAQLTDKHWIYFPEKQFPFYRLGFAHNFAPSMAPENCSSLYGECAYVDKSPAYVKRMLKEAIEKTQQLLDIKNQEIITKKIITINYAYVLYTHWREKNIAKIHQRLNEQDVYSIGRYGAWKYSSMQEAVLDGKSIIDRLIITPAKHSFYIPKLGELNNPKQQET